MRFVKLYLIALARHWWLLDILEHDDYDWVLDVIKATPQDIYDSPFWSIK